MINKKINLCAPFGHLFTLTVYFKSMGDFDCKPVVTSLILHGGGGEL